MNFSEWLESTQARRDEITAFSKIAMVNVDKAIEYSAELGLMESEADAYLTIAYADALLQARKKYPEATAKERDAYVDRDLATMEKFVNGLAIIGRVLRDRIYNRNASR